MEPTRERLGFQQGINQELHILDAREELTTTNKELESIATTNLQLEE